MLCSQIIRLLQKVANHSRKHMQLDSLKGMEHWVIFGRQTFRQLLVLPLIPKAAQAADYHDQAEYNTGNPEDDLKTQSLVKQLLYHPKLRSACPKPFDEVKVWQVQLWTALAARSA